MRKVAIAVFLSVLVTPLILSAFPDIFVASHDGPWK